MTSSWTSVLSILPGGNVLASVPMAQMDHKEGQVKYEDERLDVKMYHFCTPNHKKKHILFLRSAFTKIRSRAIDASLTVYFFCEVPLRNPISSHECFIFLLQEVSGGSPETEKLTIGSFSNLWGPTKGLEK